MRHAPHLKSSRLIAALTLAVLGVSACAGDITVAGLKQVTPETLAERAEAKLKATSGPALMQGQALGPQGIAGGNIVVGNTSRIISNNSAAIVANNTSRYGVLAVKQAPIANAIVYLTDADERFFADGGKPVTATTDSKGQYSFKTGLPVDRVIIVNVILADNRREVGFTVAKSGRNVVNVSLATNYVTEFLRSRAHELGKTMADFDLTQLAELTQKTEQALDAGDLPVPDLGIGRIGELNQTYALAVGLNKQGLGDAWAKLLGKRVLALTTVAGSGDSGFEGDGKAAVAAQLYKPKGLALDTAGNLYIADEGNHGIRKVTPEGVIESFIGKGIPQFSGDDGPAKSAGLWWPRTVAVGPGDVMYIADTLNMRIRRVGLGDKIITTKVGNPVQASGAWLNDFGGDGGPAVQAKLAGVRGIAFDSTGALVFSDSWDNDGGSWHHIRRVDRDGLITSLVGVDGKHGYNGDNKPGLETQLNYVQQLALDGQDNIYFAEPRNHRVRKYDAKTKIVTTVAGDGSDGTRGEGIAATSAQLSSPYGVAIDQTGRLFIAERGSRRIRVVLKDGTIRTLAGGGEFTGDGEAAMAALSEPHDILLEPSGNLLIADSRAAKVRRLWLKWGF